MTRTYISALLAVVLAVVAQPCDGGIILPGIQGTIFQDMDSSGVPSPGEGVPGATLQLYQDDGDGVFEPGAGDIQVGSDWVTGADGAYAFQSLDPNAGYFVQRTAMDLGGTFLPAAVSGLLKPGEIRLLIDSFDNNQVVKANPMTPMATSTLNDPMSTVLGHERDMYVQLVGGIGEVALRANAFGVTVLQYDTTSGVVGKAIVTWDGIDMSASPTPALNLGDIDLTQGGTNEGLFFRLGIDATGVNERLWIRLFDDSTSEYSEASTLLPVTDGTASGFAYLPFADFVGPVSPSRVNAIQMILGMGAKSVDAQLDLLGAIGPVVQDFAVVPEPSSLVTALVGALSALGLCRRKYKRR
jgi:large repetitive protein